MRGSGPPSIGIRQIANAPRTWGQNGHSAFGSEQVKVKKVAGMLKVIHAQADRQEALLKAESVESTESRDWRIG